jgi:hypothetical protein
MPWQGHLFIGERVHSYQEAAEVFKSLGLEIKPFSSEEDAWDVFDQAHVSKEIDHRGVKYTAEITLIVEREGGVDFQFDKPIPTDEPYTDAAVAFHLTQRYRGEILDHEHQEGGRPEPFDFDPEDLVSILKQVREWWPKAQVMIWTVFY